MSVNSDDKFSISLWCWKYVCLLKPALESGGICVVAHVTQTHGQKSCSCPAEFTARVARGAGGSGEMRQRGAALGAEEAAGLAGAPSASPGGRVVWTNQFPCGAGLSHRGVSLGSVRAASLDCRSLRKSKTLLGFGLFFFPFFVSNKQLKLRCRS